MNRLTAYMSDEYQDNKQKKDDDVMDYFASHPSTQKRVDLANRYSECFKQGLKVCK